MKWQERFLAVAGLAAATLAIVNTPTSAQDCPGFEIRRIATGLNQPKGIACPEATLREGLMMNHLFVAEAGADRIVQFATNGDPLSIFPVRSSFPVGVTCYGGGFAQDLYVGGAYDGGVRRLDVLGDDHAFGLAGMSVSGMDFGYGGDLFVGEWPTGKIWRIDPLGRAELFATVPGQARYVRFSPPMDPEPRLYVSDFLSGSIFRIDPEGNVALFAETEAGCLEGLAFSEGGPFGYYLYAGDLCSGDIYRIDHNGNVVKVWHGLLPGAADICFTKAGLDRWVMYVVDGQPDGSLWAIVPMEPTVPTAAKP